MFIPLPIHMLADCNALLFTMYFIAVCLYVCLFLQYQCETVEEATKWKEVLAPIAEADISTKLEPILSNTKGHVELKTELESFYKKHDPTQVEKVDAHVKKAFFEML